jgi:CubicO group peptidase (beta-lactamase class C family)
MAKMALDWFDLISSLVPDWMKETRTPGVAIAVIETGQPARYGCFGIQDQSSQILINPNTIFEAASLSKPLFAYGVLMLAAEGKLDLDTPLCNLSDEELIPGEKRLAFLTARRILSHSSGLPNWFPTDEQRSLLFTPGERFGYSGEGYFYLQRVVEKIICQSLEEFARERIFSTLKMPRSSYVWREELVLETAQGHDEEANPIPKDKPNSGNAGTSLHTSVSEYSNFVEHILSTPSLPSGICLNTMPIPQTAIDEQSAWGLGLGLKLIGGNWVFWQWGDNRGFKHLVAGSREQGKGLCVLTNSQNGYQVWSQILRQTLDPQEEIFTWLSNL